LVTITGQDFMLRCDAAHPDATSPSCPVIVTKALVPHIACDEVHVDENEARVDVDEVDDEAP
jgi:ligand-binding sensor protein